jgi:hypothetical protein
MPSSYTVRRGDTLSGIAGRYYGNPALYPSLWWVNKGKVRDPNRIEVGQRLRLSHWHPQAAWLTAAARKADPPVRAVRHGAVRAHRDSRGRIWKVTYGYPYKCGDGDGDGYDTPCSVVFPHHHQRVTAVYRSGHRVVRRSHRRVVSGSYHGSGSMERCIIRAESGGNSQVMNSSGHYGLYQFSSQTWQAHGGSAATFGHASVSEQRRVFQNTVAANGYRDWTPYDGC